MDDQNQNSEQALKAETQAPDFSVWCHRAYREHRNLNFPLLSDFEPKGEVARKYGVYRDGEGVTERALFVIDGEGRIAWSYVSPIGVNPGADGILMHLRVCLERR